MVANTLGLSIEEVVRITVEAIYSNADLAKKLVLKGGQAIRIVENISSRFSTDLDFSTSEEIKEFEVFFDLMESALLKKFEEEGHHIFDFKYSRRPKIAKSGFPDMWQGWEITFKIIEKRKENLDIEIKRRQAILPQGAQGSKITIDISQFEYCSSLQKVRVRNIDVVAYSRSLLAVEKLRALCQQCKGYKFSPEIPKGRSRDFYDIEKLYSKAITDGEIYRFVEESKKNLVPCFQAKKVDPSLLEEIFKDEYLAFQKLDWPMVQSAVGRPETFEYYVEICKQFVLKLRQ